MLVNLEKCSLRPNTYLIIHSHIFHRHLIRWWRNSHFSNFPSWFDENYRIIKEPPVSTSLSSKIVLLTTITQLHELWLDLPALPTPTYTPFHNGPMTGRFVFLVDKSLIQIHFFTVGRAFRHAEPSTRTVNLEWPYLVR